MKPTEDAKMQNDEDYGFVSIVAEENQRVIDEVNALIRTQAARIAELEAALSDALSAHRIELERRFAAEAEVARLRGVVAQCRGMADEGADVPNAAYRWGERIEEVCIAGEPLDDYAPWAWPRTAKEE